MNWCQRQKFLRPLIEAKKDWLEIMELYRAEVARRQTIMWPDW